MGLGFASGGRTKSSPHFGSFVAEGLGRPDNKHHCFFMGRGGAAARFLGLVALGVSASSEWIWIVRVEPCMDSFCRHLGEKGVGDSARPCRCTLRLNYVRRDLDERGEARL